MLCATHNHWDTDMPCSVCHPPAIPKMAVGEPVTMTVSEEPPAIPAALRAGDDIEDLEIPPFLQRAKDGSFLHPELHKCGTTLPSTPTSVSTTTTSPAMEDLSDAALADRAADTTLTLADRQPIYREMHRREDLRKARERIAIMKAKKEKQSKPPVRDRVAERLAKRLEK